MTLVLQGVTVDDLQNNQELVDGVETFLSNTRKYNFWISDFASRQLRLGPFLLDLN